VLSQTGVLRRWETKPSKKAHTRPAFGQPCHSTGTAATRTIEPPDSEKGRAVSAPVPGRADCGNRALMPVSDAVIYSHLAGEKTIGVYPLLPEDTRHFV